jgi:hypothetical protein
MNALAPQSAACRPCHHRATPRFTARAYTEGSKLSLHRLTAVPPMIAMMLREHLLARTQSRAWNSSACSLVSHA